MRNVVDDGSFEELGRDIARITELSSLVHDIKQYIEKEKERIDVETLRLSKQGYAIRDLKIVMYAHNVTRMLHLIGIND